MREKTYLGKGCFVSGRAKNVPKRAKLTNQTVVILNTQARKTKRKGEKRG